MAGRPTLAALLAALLLAGCVQTSAIEAQNMPMTESARPVVIAVLDSGTYPHLPIFRTDDPSLVRSVPTSTFDTIVLSEGGSLRERYRLDEEALRARGVGRLTHFAGTRLFSISFASFDAPPHIDSWPHGAHTTYLAAREAPSAIIVSVQADPRTCPVLRGCFMDPSVVAGMEWIADQPWIDVVSVSIAAPAGVPTSGDVHPDVARYLAATERAARDGKIVVNGAGNSIVPQPFDYVGGPPWIVSVGGADADERGHAVLSAKAADVVANFTDLVPAEMSETLAWSSGTSLATPIVAGTLARAMHLLREEGHDAAPEPLRHALNATGVYFAATEWDPALRDRGPGPFGYVVPASMPVVAQAQMGWGHIDGSLAPEIARRVLENDLAPPPGKEQAALAQAQWQAAREAYWANVAR